MCSLTDGTGPLFEQYAVREKMPFFYSKLMSLESRISLLQHNMECVAILTMGAAGSTECLHEAMLSRQAQCPMMILATMDH